MGYTEKQLISPALYVIYKNPGIKMEKIIVELQKALKPSGKDAQIAKNRSDTYFSQKVRNLKSHRENNKMEKYTRLTPAGEYFLTDEGKTALSKDYDAMYSLFELSCDESDRDILIKTTLSGSKKKVTVFIDDEVITEGAVAVRSRKTIERSARLRELARLRQQDKNDFKCSVCGFDFEKVYGEVGKEYIHFHHIKPISEYVDSELGETDLKTALNNLISVCPNCHCMIHKVKVDNPVEYVRSLVHN